MRIVSSRFSDYKSQKGQDRWVLETLGNKREGYFVDLAATDGMVHSNSWVLEKKFGWRGIAIEPNPYFFPKLQRNRECVKLQLVVDQQAGTTPFRIDNLGLGGIVADDTDNNEQLRGEELRHAEITELESKTLTQILDEHDAPHRIEYLSLDVEGAEERVIRGLDLGKYTFECMTIERPSAFVNECLFQNGYRFVKNYNFDTFYVHESHPHIDQIECQPFEQVSPKGF